MSARDIDGLFLALKEAITAPKPPHRLGKDSMKNEEIAADAVMQLAAVLLKDVSRIADALAILARIELERENRR